MKPVRIPRNLVILGLSLAFLCSCVDIDARFSVASDGTASLNALFRVSDLFIPLIGYESLKPSPTAPTASATPSPAAPAASPFRPSSIAIPVSAPTMAGLVASHPGTRLDSFQADDSMGSTSIRMGLRFDKLETAVSFLQDIGIPISVLSSGARRGISIQVDKASAVLVKDGSETSMVDQLDRLFGSWGADLAVEAPLRIQSVRGGKAEGRTATFGIPLKDIALLSSPLKWEVLW